MSVVFLSVLMKFHTCINAYTRVNTANLIAAQPSSNIVTRIRNRRSLEANLNHNSPISGLGEPYRTLECGNKAIVS